MRTAKSKKRRNGTTWSRTMLCQSMRSVDHGLGKSPLRKANCEE
jgi:hypothetical protein